MLLYSANILNRFQKSFQGFTIGFLTVFLILNSNCHKILCILCIYAYINRLFGAGYRVKVLIHKKFIIFSIIIPGHIHGKTIIGETILAVKEYPLKEKNCFII